MVNLLSEHTSSIKKFKKKREKKLKTYRHIFPSSDMLQPFIQSVSKKRLFANWFFFCLEWKKNVTLSCK